MNIKTWLEGGEKKGSWKYRTAIEDCSDGYYLTKGRKYPTMVNDGNVYTVDDTGRLVQADADKLDDI